MTDAAIRQMRGWARNNATANHRLLTACARLSHEDWIATRTSFFPSLQRTLNHILICDWYYVDALEGGTLGPAAFANQVPHPDFAGYAAAQRAVDQRLIRFCDLLAEDRDLERPVKLLRNRPVPLETVGTILPHLFEHQIHHRGQAHAMLAGTAVPPPQLDEFFLNDDEHRRTSDLAAIGCEPAW
jgi:uncharacterized damage-inducible protein DinB